MSESVLTKATELYNQANEAALEEEVEKADTLYTEGIQLLESKGEPIPHRFLNARSSNYLKMKKYDLGLADALKVVNAIDASTTTIKADSPVFEDLCQALVRVGSSLCLLNRPIEAVVHLRRLGRLGRPHERWMETAIKMIKATGDEQALEDALREDKPTHQVTTRATDSTTASDPSTTPEEKTGESGNKSPENHPTSTSESESKENTKSTGLPQSSTTTSGGLASKVQEGWYDQGETATVVYYAKGAIKEKVYCWLSHGGRVVHVCITMPDNSVFNRTLVVFSPVKPSTEAPLPPTDVLTTGDNGTSADVSDMKGIQPHMNPFKVELKLVKLPVINNQVPVWKRLEYDPSAVFVLVNSPAVLPASLLTAPPGTALPIPPAVATTTTTPTTTTTSSSTQSGPVGYPSNRGKKWDDVVAELDADAEEETNGMQGFLQKIYANADDRVKRAMIKSFQTSAGTVLSTNWDEVEKTDYSKDIKPPAGQEFVPFKK